MNLSKETVIERLQKFGIKPSMQRIAVLDYLLAHFTHPTVDEIYAALSPEMPTLSKTTVYNTLKLFSEAGLTLCLNLDERNQRFDGTTTPHAHFICTRCGAVKDLFLDNEKLFELPDVDSIKIEKVEISYFGLCHKCLTDF